MRIGCLLAPHLPVQIERGRHPDLKNRPLIVGGLPWDEDAVLDASPKAERAGVQPGMRLHRAQGRCPGALVLPADRDAYAAVHALLIETLRGFTPHVEPLALGHLLAEAPAPRGAREPEVGDRRWLGALLHEARLATGLEVRVGLAPHRFTAEQAATTAEAEHPALVLPADERAFLAPLSLSTLPVEAEMLRRLRLLGVLTLGALARLPRPAVIRQFGTDAGFYHDLAAGRDPRPVLPEAPPLELAATHTWEPPVLWQEALTIQLERLGAQLAGRLIRRGYQAQGLRLVLEDEAGRRVEAAVPVEPPTADREALIRRATTLLQRQSLTAAVTALTLTCYPLRPAYLGATQLTLFSAPVNARLTRLQETLRRLRARFGEWVIQVAALLGPPAPRPVQVTTTYAGHPHALIFPDRIVHVRRLYEHWRVRRRWWATYESHDYYRLETRTDEVRMVFHDRQADAWYLERRASP